MLDYTQKWSDLRCEIKSHDALLFILSRAYPDTFLPWGASLHLSVIKVSPYLAMCAEVACRYAPSAYEATLVLNKLSTVNPTLKIR